MRHLSHIPAVRASVVLEIYDSCHNRAMLPSSAYTEEWVTAFGHGTKLKYKKGEFIIRPGEAPPGVFFIESGLVKAYDITKYGEENLLIIRKEHEIFPLIWAITGSERRIIYQTLSPTVAYRLSRNDYLKHIDTHPAATAALLSMAVEMYRTHSERIMNLEYRSVRERLISFLLTMIRRFGEKADDGSVMLAVPLRQQDIASSINASRETTSRELSALEKKGLISTGTHIILVDVPKLKSFL